MKLIIDIDCDLLNRIHEAKSVPDMCGTDTVNTINAIKSGIPTYGRQTGEWISCKVRQPDKNGDYLVTTKWGEVLTMTFALDLYSVDKYDFSKYRRKKKAGWYYFDREYGFCESGCVIAWQPLPETYKEANDETE